MYDQSINHTSLNKKDRSRCYAKSPTAQDMFHPIPAVISCAGVNGRGRLLSQEPSQGAGLILIAGRTSVLEQCVSLCSCPLKIVATWQQSKSSHIVKWSMNQIKAWLDVITKSPIAQVYLKQLQIKEEGRAWECHFCMKGLVHVHCMEHLGLFSKADLVCWLFMYGTLFVHLQMVASKLVHNPPNEHLGVPFHS